MMDDLLAADEIHEGVIADMDKSVVEEALRCRQSGDIYSAQCRLSISQLITHQTKFAMPDVVYNLQDCLERRNYPQDYAVDYMFPPRGCTKEANNVFIAHSLLWALQRRKQQSQAMPQ